MAADLAERLAARTLELVDVPSESCHEEPLAAHVADVLRAGGVAVRDAGDTCLIAGQPGGVVLGGHFDTVPAQDNRPGRRDADAVHGLGASDMKGALAVMIELALAGAPFGLCLFGREELPVAESALAPLLEREPGLRGARLVVMMEPTDNAIHAGCLGNINATWNFRGRSGHSARPWQADNAIVRAARGIAALADVEPVAHSYEGLTFTEVASVTRIGGGIAANVIPDMCSAHVNYRYPPGKPAQEAEAWLRSRCEPFGDLTVDSNAPSAPVVVSDDLVVGLRRAGDLDVEAKQAWTPVAEFAAAGLPAVNFGPGAPAQAHRRDEHVRIDALVRSYEVLETFGKSL